MIREHNDGCAIHVSFAKSGYMGAALLEKKSSFVDLVYQGTTVPLNKIYRHVTVHFFSYKKLFLAVKEREI